jgi:hypothetical protein
MNEKSISNPLSKIINNAYLGQYILSFMNLKTLINIRNVSKSCHHLIAWNELFQKISYYFIIPSLSEFYSNKIIIPFNRPYRIFHRKIYENDDVNIIRLFWYDNIKFDIIEALKYGGKKIRDFLETRLPTFTLKINVPIFIDNYSMRNISCDVEVFNIGGKIYTLHNLTRIM